MEESAVIDINSDVNNHSDQNHYGDYIKVRFDDIFSSPPGFRMSKIWKFLKIIYKYIQKFIYYLLTLTFGIGLTIAWGIFFAVFAFLFVWVINPLHRIILILFTPLKACSFIIYQSTLEPFVLTLASFWSRIKVRYQPLSQSTNDNYYKMIMSKSGSMEVVNEDRDPNNLNQHLQILWDDVIGEPEGVRSPECAWRLSNICFKYSKNACYILLTVLVAPLAALCLGISFACLAFEHIWCVAPCIRTLKINCAACRTCTRACTQAIVVPCAEALGTFWGGIRLQHHTTMEPPERREDVLLI